MCLKYIQKPWNNTDYIEFLMYISILTNFKHDCDMNHMEISLVEHHGQTSRLDLFAVAMGGKGKAKSGTGAVLPSFS